ncbi:hypothetical protein WN943_029136 [Citrus x changshan-huyou]
MPVLLFRHIPIRLAFTVRSSISEGCEETSVLLAISVVASVTSSPFLFFVAYLCLIISSLRYGTVASLSQHIFNWFRNLTAIITPITGTILIVINRLNGNQEIAEQVDEENIIEAETNRIQNLRPSSTDDDENNLEVVVILVFQFNKSQNQPGPLNIPSSIVKPKSKHLRRRRREIRSSQLIGVDRHDSNVTKLETESLASRKEFMSCCCTLRDLKVGEISEGAGESGLVFVNVVVDEPQLCRK